MLTIGDKAPDFKEKNEKGVLVSLDDFAGKKLVLYFYPKDATPTCTTEACNLRDNYERLLAAGYEVLGVSTDTEKSHQRFIARQQLPFSLLADTEQRMAKAYGVWGEKKLFGKDYLGILRTTFVIDEKGFIEEVITKVKSAAHADQILKVSAD